MSDMVINNAAQHRFELEVSGHLAASYYKREGDVITFEHTEVPAELGGQGIGSRLVKDALDRARRNGWRVGAQCPLAQAYTDQHAEYQELLKACVTALRQASKGPRARRRDPGAAPAPS